MDIIVRRVDFAREWGCGVERQNGPLESHYKTERDEPLSRIYRGIDERGRWGVATSVLKNRVAAADAAGGEKAANKSRLRKRITRESRTARREIW